MKLSPNQGQEIFTNFFCEEEKCISVHFPLKYKIFVKMCRKPDEIELISD